MIALLATLVAGLGYGLLFPPYGGTALAWVALAPLAVALRGRSFAAAAGLAGLYAWVATASVIPWLVPTLHEHFEQSRAFSVAFWLLFSATALAPYYAPLLAAQAWVTGRLAAHGRGASLWAPFGFAAAWVAAEWLRVQLGFKSPWTRLGDSQIDAVWLRQCADLFGVYGLSFLLALSGGVIAELFCAARDRLRGETVQLAPIAVGVAVVAGLAVAALGYGQSRLRAIDDVGGGLEIGVVQGNLDAELRWSRRHASRVLQHYGGLTRDLLRVDADPPDVVIWPENAIQVGVDDPTYGPPLLKVAARTPLIVGAPRSEPADGARRTFNSAFLLGVGEVDESSGGNGSDADPPSAGEVLNRYDKRRLLPFSETRPLGGLASLGTRGDLDTDEYAAGTRAASFDVNGYALAPLICMEALYPALVREAVRAGADAVVNLSNDAWLRGRGGAEQHLAMVRFRAIETRRPVVRSTSSGISALIGIDGGIHESIGRNQSGVLRAELVAALEDPTLYTRIGDAFAIACALCVAIAVAAVRWNSAQPATPGTRRGSSSPPRINA